MVEYGYIAIFLFMALIVAMVMVLLPVLLRLFGLVPRKPGLVKNSPFECGMETIGKTWIRFNFRYYFYALMFVTIDIIVLFVYPWATELKKLGYAGLIAIVVFIGFITVAYIYAWKKRVLEWK